SDNLLKVLVFFSGQFNEIREFGTSHGLSPPLSTLLSVYLLSLTLSKSESTCDCLYLDKEGCNGYYSNHRRAATVCGFIPYLRYSCWRVSRTPRKLPGVRGRASEF